MLRDNLAISSSRRSVKIPFILTVPSSRIPSEGDIIDFYGPCNYDPLGKAEVMRQRDDYRRYRNRFDGETD